MKCYGTISKPCFNKYLINLFTTKTEIRLQTGNVMALETLAGRKDKDGTVLFDLLPAWSTTTTPGRPSALLSLARLKKSACS